MAITARPYETAADLRRMQALQQELWAVEGERTHTHIGDLAWMTTSVPDEQNWRRRLWLEGDRCVAWAWLFRPGSLDYEVHRDLRGGRLHEEVLDWLEREAAPDAELSTYVMDGDDVSRALLERRGFSQPADAKWFAYHVHPLDRNRAAGSHSVLSRGFTRRTVVGEADLRARVEVHRAVWHPSRVTEQSFREVMRTWPYRPDLDCVLEAPDGRFAAYALCWYDERNRVGELEPVGTHPDFRRQGLGATVCRYGLRRLHEEGAEKAIVYAVTDATRAFYESVGFRCHTYMRELRKSPP